MTNVGVCLITSKHLNCLALRNADSNLERLALTRGSRNVDYTATGGFEEEVRNDQICQNGMILNAVALRNHQSHHGVRSVMC